MYTQNTTIERTGIQGDAGITVFVTSSFCSTGCIPGHRDHTLTACFPCTLPVHRRASYAAA